MVIMYAACVVGFMVTLNFGLTIQAKKAGETTACQNTELTILQSWQSSTYPGSFWQQIITALTHHRPFSADKTTDGDVDTYSQTNEEVMPWWQAQLDVTDYVNAVTIGTNAFVLEDLLIEVGYVSVEYDTATWQSEWDTGKQQCATHGVAMEMESTVTVNCESPLLGNYLRVTMQSISPRTLSMREVIIEGVSSGCTTTTTTTTTTTVSTVSPALDPLTSIILSSSSIVESSFWLQSTSVDLTYADISTSSVELISSDISTTSVELTSSDISTSNVDLTSFDISTSSVELTSSDISTSNVDLTSSDISTSSVELISSDISTTSVELTSSDISTSSVELISSDISTTSVELTSSDISTSNVELTSSDISTSSIDLNSSYISKTIITFTSSDLSTPYSVNSPLVLSSTSPFQLSSSYSLQETFLGTSSTETPTLTSSVSAVSSTSTFILSTTLSSLLISSFSSSSAAISEISSSVIPVWCPCTCEQAALIADLTGTNKTNDEVAQEIEELIAENTVNVKATTASQRKLKSADDSRASSKIVGTIGVVFFAMVFGLIILSDLPILFRAIKNIAQQFYHRHHQKHEENRPASRRKFSNIGDIPSISTPPPVSI